MSIPLSFDLECIVSGRWRFSIHTFRVALIRCQAQIRTQSQMKGANFSQIEAGLARKSQQKAARFASPSIHFSCAVAANPLANVLTTRARRGARIVANPLKRNLIFAESTSPKKLRRNQSRHCFCFLYRRRIEVDGQTSNSLRCDEGVARATE
jgi:hypothetical protein